MCNNFIKSSVKGKNAEERAIQYFHEKNVEFEDVREIKYFQNIDVDFVTKEYGKIETKLNLHDALKGKQGKFFWVETAINYSQSKAWFFVSEADYYFFIQENSNVCIMIKNDFNFQDYVNKAIAIGDHSFYGNFRYDQKLDNRSYGVVVATCMRIYLDDLKDSGVQYHLFRLPKTI